MTTITVYSRQQRSERLRAAAAMSACRLRLQYMWNGCHETLLFFLKCDAYILKAVSDVQTTCGFNEAEGPGSLLGCGTEHSRKQEQPACLLWF